MKEILNVYKIENRQGDYIGTFILSYLPKDCVMIPYLQHGFIITRSEVSDLIPDKILITLPTQKPKVFFIQPLVLNQEIRDSKNKIKNMPEFLVLGDFATYIKNKYEVKSINKVEERVSKMIESLSEFVNLESR